MGTYKINRVVEGVVVTTTYTTDVTVDTTVYEDIEGLHRVGSKYYIKDIQLTDYVVNLYRTNIYSRNAIINFFNWLSLNPKQEIYKNILLFIENWNLEITTNGFLVLFRNVIKVEEGVYTDSYSKTMRYELGSSAKLDSEDVDWNSDNTCSKGLHAGARDWMKDTYFGDTPIKVFINPMNIAACPPKDTYGKLRATEIYFAEEANWEDGKLNDNYQLVHDNDYATINFFELSEKLGKSVRTFLDINEFDKKTLLENIQKYLDRDAFQYDYSEYDDDSDDDYSDEYLY